MQKEWRYFLLALGFFTRLPVPSFNDFQESDLNHAAKYFPLVGIIVGVIAALSYYLSALVLPHSIAVFISMAASIYCTGAFHEDGLADSADGLGGGWTVEQVLTIMQDSRLGTYGAVALFLALFGKFQLLDNMSYSLIPFVVIAGHALSRLCAVWVMATLSYVKFNGKAKPLATEIKLADLVIANIFGLLPFTIFLGLLIGTNYSHLLTLQLILCVALPISLALVWWRSILKKRLSGYTGDGLGAMQQISEIAFYLGVLFWPPL